MSDDSWLKHLLEKLLGTSFAGPEDPRTWHCRPLVVTNEGLDVVFAGNAIVEFAPTGPEAGSARAPANEPTVEPLDVNRMVVTHSGDRGRTPNGLMLRGVTRDGKRFTWRINGAATAFLKRRIHEKWLGVSNEIDLDVEAKYGSLGSLE